LAAAWLWRPAPSLAEEPPALDGQPAVQNGQTAQDDSGGKFIRLLRSDDGTVVALQTAIVAYGLPDAAAQAKDGPKQPPIEVHLIGAVHIGEAEYYEALNRAFQEYDAVLYELVAPEGTRVERGDARRDRSVVSRLQVGMKEMLELDFQLEHIDYQQENLVHADMSPEEFARTMEKRGESVWSIVLRMLGQSIAQQSKNPSRTSDFDLLMALFDRNRALKLKRLLAEQFEDLEGTMLAFEGNEGSTIISERNKKALEVLKRELQAGKRKLAIFYGAGHLPDMEARLRQDFGLVRRGERWLTAWDMSDAAHPLPKDASPTAEPPARPAPQAPSGQGR
jgi:arsenate reductase-like glutaredoxin family protein